MLSPEYLESLPEPLLKLWQQVEDDILRDIGRRIRKMDTLTDTAAYQAYRLEQTKLLHTDIVKLIAKYSGKSESAIRKMLTDAAVETLRTEDVVHAAAGVKLTPINESQNLLNLLNAGYRQTAGTWRNLTATTANTVTRQFEDALDRAWLQVSSGAFDYQTAIRRAVDGLAEHMDGVTYPSGHHDSLEVAVRRATLTGVNQTCGKLQWERREQAGCEFVEVTAHSGAREYAGGGPRDHAGWQGKVYHVGGAIDHEGEHYDDFETATGYGTGDGLCGWNCRHNYCSFWPGISSRVYTDAQLAELSAKNIEYNGQMYSRYELSQMQRAKERNVRKWKKTWMIEKEAGLDTTGSAIRLRNARKSLSDFAKATGGRVDSARTATWNTSTLPGKHFGHSEATSANWDVRKEETVLEKVQVTEIASKAAASANIRDSSNKPLEISENSDTLNVKVNAAETAKTDEHKDLSKYKRITDAELKDWKKACGNCKKEEYKQINKHNKPDGSKGGYVRSHRAWEFNEELRKGLENQLDDDDKKTLATIRKLCKQNRTDRAILLDRYVDSNYLTEYSGFFNKFREDLVDDAVTFVNGNLVGTNKVEKGIVSASYGANVLMDRDIHVKLHCPEGTHMFVTNNKRESEVLFHDGLSYEIISASKEAYSSLFGNRHRLVLDVVVINNGL